MKHKILYLLGLVSIFVAGSLQECMAIQANTPPRQDNTTDEKPSDLDKLALVCSGNYWAASPVSSDFIFEQELEAAFAQTSNSQDQRVAAMANKIKPYGIKQSDQAFRVINALSASRDQKRAFEGIVEGLLGNGGDPTARLGQVSQEQQELQRAFKALNETCTNIRNAWDPGLIEIFEEQAVSEVASHGFHSEIGIQTSAAILVVNNRSGESRSNVTVIIEGFCDDGGVSRYLFHVPTWEDGTTLVTEPVYYLSCITDKGQRDQLFAKLSLARRESLVPQLIRNAKVRFRARFFWSEFVATEESVKVRSRSFAKNELVATVFSEGTEFRTENDDVILRVMSSRKTSKGVSISFSVGGADEDAPSTYSGQIEPSSHSWESNSFSFTPELKRPSEFLRKLMAETPGGRRAFEKSMTLFWQEGLLEEVSIAGSNRWFYPVRE